MANEEGDIDESFDQLMTSKISQDLNKTSSFKKFNQARDSVNLAKMKKNFVVNRFNNKASKQSRADQTELSEITEEKSETSEVKIKRKILMKP